MSKHFFKNHDYSQEYSNTNGFSLIEILISLSVMLVVGLGFITMIENQNRQIVAVSTKMTRDLLKNQLERVLTDKNAIVRSLNLAGNEGFKACYLGGTTSTCATSPCCVAGSNLAFSALDPTDPNAVFSPASGKMLTGTGSAPVRYAIDGASCTTLGDRCPFEALTSFTAVCAGGAASCDKAQSMSIEYSLAVGAGVKVIGGSLKKSTGSFPVLGLAAAATTCPFDHPFLTGYDASGNMICKSKAEIMEAECLAQGAGVTWDGVAQECYVNGCDNQYCFAGNAYHLAVWAGGGTGQGTADYRCSIVRAGTTAKFTTVIKAAACGGCLSVIWRSGAGWASGCVAGCGGDAYFSTIRCLIPSSP